MVNSADKAVRAAERVGYPVVVKPLNANHGRGISVGLENADSVLAAFELAQSKTIAAAGT